MSQVSLYEFEEDFPNDVESWVFDFDQYWGFAFNVGDYVLSDYLVIGYFNSFFDEMVLIEIFFEDMMLFENDLCG